MRRALHVLMATVVAILGWMVAPTPSAVAAPAPALVAYTYDAPVHDAPENYAAPERGPPAATNAHSATTYDAVDRRSDGTSARQSGARPRATYAYDDTRLLVQRDILAGSTSRSASVRNGDLSGFERALVAAKSGDDLVDVWRVVGPDEAAGITKTGGYSVQLGGEGKYFFPTRGQAENLGQMYNKANWPGPQTLTRGQVPRSVISRAEPVNAGTEGPGWFIRSPDIPRICNVLCMGTIQ